MPGIIEGYSYDIFISYRQNDNKYDGWVTEFVDNLNKELEANIKDKVSVYFDINPTDGLLETDSVDQSLENKLKCQIFIPVISRTYCDPKSFAWQHEFCAFNKLSKEDRFGRDIKLASGNVASRILPVKIHDLDPEDKALLENEIGGVLRGIEFIYKEPGVNRPLTPKDSEDKNTNKTSYRNQINKVANAVKEIITALKKQSLHTKEATKEDLNVKFGNKKNMITKVIIGSVITLVLIVLGILFITQLIKPLEKSIAVLPFHNYSDDPGQEYMSDGLTDEIINHLYKIKSFNKVVSLSSVLTYKGTEKKLPQIADELKVNYILEGTYKKIGDKVRVTAQLIEPKNDKHLWQNEYDRPYMEVIAIQADIAIQIADQLKAFLTSSEQQNIQKMPTTNQEAYELLQKATYIAYTDTTTFAGFQGLNYIQLIELAVQAIKLDPNYADAYSFAGSVILGSANYGGGLEMSSAGWDAMHYFEKSLEIDPNNGNAHIGLAQLNDWFIWDYVRAEKEFLKGLELLPNLPGAASQYGEFLIKMNRLDDAESCFSILESNFNIQYREIRRKILSGNQKESRQAIHEFLDQWKEEGYIWAGEAYIWLEEYDSALFYFESVKPSVEPELLIPRFQASLALACQKTNNPTRARSIINRLIAKSDTTSAMSPDFFTGLYYSGVGKIDSAFYWLEKAYKNRSPEMPWLKVDPIFKSLKNDDRYWDLYERTGHKAYDEYLEKIKK